MRPGNSPLPPAALAGAVDLSGLKKSPPAGGAPPGAAANGGQPAAPSSVVDVTEATFGAEVLERSTEVPVVIDFWAEWCAPCKALSPVLEKLAAEGGGSWILAKIDVDANQRLAAAAGVQSIPAVKAVIDGQVVGEFTGAIPEPQVRQWITTLMEAAARAPDEAGAAPGGPEPTEEQVDPRIIAAEDALQRGDADAAEAALRTVLTEQPGHPQATAALAQVELFRRVSDLPDLDGIVAAADAAPDDVEVQGLAADVELLSGQVEQAFARLVNLVRRTEGAERDAARNRLLALFAVLSPEDPRVARARRDLTAALF